MNDNRISETHDTIKQMYGQLIGYRDTPEGRVEYRTDGRVMSGWLGDRIVTTRRLWRSPVEGSVLILWCFWIKKGKAERLVFSPSP